MISSICCGIYVENEGYAFKLERLLAQKLKNMCNINVYTQKEALNEFIQKNSMDILIVSEYVSIDDMDTVNISKIVILCEDEEKAIALNTDSVGKIRYIYRYQSSDRLIEYIERETKQVIGQSENFSEQSEDKSCQVYGIYSCASGAINTKYGIQLAEKLNKVIYISFESMPVLEHILKDYNAEISKEKKSSILPEFIEKKDRSDKGLDANRTISDILYYTKIKSEETADIIKQACINVNGVDYIRTVIYPDDAQYYELTDVECLVNIIKEQFSYQYIIIDIGAMIRCPWRLFGVCDKVHWIICDDDYSRIYKSLMNEYLYEYQTDIVRDDKIVDIYL